MGDEETDQFVSTSATFSGEFIFFGYVISKPRLIKTKYFFFIIVRNNLTFFVKVGTGEFLFGTRPEKTNRMCSKILMWNIDLIKTFNIFVDYRRCNF